MLSLSLTGNLDNDGRPLSASVDRQAATLNSNSCFLLSFAKYLASLNGKRSSSLADEGGASASTTNDGSAVSVMLLEHIMSFVPDILNPATNGMTFADVMAILCNLALGAEFGHFYVRKFFF